MSKHKDLLLAVAALVVVLVVLALGFQRLGPHDERRIQDLRWIAEAIYARQKPLPATLAELPHASLISLNDPVTNAPYEYHPTSGTIYELCATFATASAANEDFQMGPVFWSHPKGRHCYQLNKSDDDLLIHRPPGKP